VLGTFSADGTQEQAGEPAVTTRADDEHLSPFALLDENVRWVAIPHRQREPLWPASAKNPIGSRACGIASFVLKVRKRADGVCAQRDGVCPGDDALDRGVKAFGQARGVAQCII